MDAASILSIVAVVGLLFISAFYRFSIKVWTISFAIVLFTITMKGHLGFFLLSIGWLIFLAAALFSNLPAYRQRYIIQPAFDILQKQMPTISSTERAAIDAGDTWWEKELFCGTPDWQKLLKTPKPILSSEEQSFIDNQVNTLCEMISDWDVVYRDKNLSQQVWDYLKKEKFFAMVIPKQYGGRGFSALAHSTVVTKIATRSISAAVTTMVPNSLGPGELLVHYGTEAQKNYYLPRLASGDEIPCFALTAPDAGSDAGAIPDCGVVCKGDYNGQTVLGIRLSWDKRYITLAPVATLLGLAIHLYDPDHLLGDKKNIGITLCLIPTAHPGVEVGNRHLPMYMAFMNGPTRGKDVFIPLDWIIGGPEMAGKGWRMLMECLSIGRSISLPALSTACGKAVYRMTGAYARIRRQFNTPIASFEGIEESLGYIAGYTYMLEACRTMTAGAVDQQINPSIVSAIAKYHMTEMARRIVQHAMDVHAGHMVQAGPRNVLANAYLAMPISITVEGANILTRNLIIFGQGAIRCHPYILKEIEILTASTRDIKALDDVMLSHIGFYIANGLRAFAYGLTGGYFISVPAKNHKIKRYMRQINRMSTALALVADTSLILLGGSLKRRERLSARLGDVLSHLYLASTVLKYYHDQQKPASDVDYVCWCLHECLYKIQIAFDEIFDNYPYKWVGKLLGWIVFPFGTAYKHPRDRLHHKIVDPMLSPSEFRDRMTTNCFISHDENNLLNRMDKALQLLPNVEPLIKKLNKAVATGSVAPHFDYALKLADAEKAGILNNAEVDLLTEFEALRSEIIKVNEFSFDMQAVIA